MADKRGYGASGYGWGLYQGGSLYEVFALGEAQAEGAAYPVLIPPVRTLDSAAVGELMSHGWAGPERDIYASGAGLVTSEAYVLSEYQWVLQCPDEVVWAEGSRYG